MTIMVLYECSSGVACIYISDCHLQFVNEQNEIVDFEAIS